MLRKGRFLAVAAVLALGLQAGVEATTWVADFSSITPESWTGSDAGAVAGYPDPANPETPRTFSVTIPLDYGSLPAGWLTQGVRDGNATTAKFYNVAGDAKGGRTRFATLLPNTLDAAGGIAFAWTCRIGNYAVGRGPVQLAFTRDGANGNNNVPAGSNNEYNAYIRLQNGVTVSIRTDGGGAYTNLGDVTLPVSISDDGFHQWSTSIIVLSDGMAHWKLWIDGVLLEFPGTNGVHDIDPAGGTDVQRFSFKTAAANFSGPTGTTSTPYISLGELQNATFDQWDFEFDCVAYRDDGLATNFTCGQPAQSCRSSVSPGSTQTLSTLKGGTAVPASAAFTVSNSGITPLSYTVSETDQAGNPQDCPWLTLSKTGGGPVDPAASDTVTAGVTDTNLAHGTYTAYVTFTDTCTPPTRVTRQVDLVVTDCAFSVFPSSEIARSLETGSPVAVSDAVFTIANTGTTGLSCTVQKEGTCDWLTLDKTAVGPLDHAQADTVRASLDATGLVAGVHTCTLRFSSTRPDCSNAPPDQLRTVSLHILQDGTAFQQLNAEFTTFTGTDLLSSTPLVSCDPADLATQLFFVDESSAIVSTLPPGWLGQGSINEVPTTAKFWNVQDGNTGRVRFRVMQGFDHRYDPAKGLGVAWRMRVGNYAITRGPVQLVFSGAPGPLGTNPATASVAAELIYSAFIRVQNGTELSILNRSGAQYTGINTLVLPASIADEYHQWTASVCLDPGSDPATTDDLAYWNLWLDGIKLMFTGSGADGTGGSVAGPGGQVYSFRTISNSPGGDPFIALGDIGNNPLTDIWDMEFDWVRTVSWNVPGAPFWDGEGCMADPLCNRPGVDVDGDHDVDMEDFAVLQRCLMLEPGSVLDADRCRCVDTNGDGLVNETDFQRFLGCATGSDVAWAPSVGCP
jgi:hypothetical protein